MAARTCARMRVHAKAKGVEPITGSRYSANNPEAQLWIHVTGWHSVLKCYERYGPSPLSPPAESRFWAESRIAAELQTCKPTDGPASRDGTSPTSAASCASRSTPTGRCITCCGRHATAVRLWAGSRLLAPAAIATLPKWMRHMGNFDQPAAVDAAVTPAAAGHGAGFVCRQLPADAGDGAHAGAADRRGVGPASDRGTAGAAADCHSGGSPRTAGRARLTRTRRARRRGPRA